VTVIKLSFTFSSLRSHFISSSLYRRRIVIQLVSYRSIPKLTRQSLTTRADGGGGGGAAVVDAVSVSVVDAGGVDVVDIGGDADADGDAVASMRVDTELSGADAAEMSMSPYVSVRCADDRTADAYDTDDGACGGRLRDGVINFDGLDSDSRLDARRGMMGSEDDRDVAVSGALVRE
jgi:hypothetical protein